MRTAVGDVCVEELLPVTCRLLAVAAGVARLGGPARVVFVAAVLGAGLEAFEEAGDAEAVPFFEGAAGGVDAGASALVGEDGDFVAAIMECRKPSIVAFNGAAAGVGLTLTLPCDIRIAVDTAKFGCVFTRRGLVPEAGSAWFLPRIVGLPTALRWCLTGAMVPAAEALAAGLVSELCPADALQARARALAMEIAANTAPVAVALTRRLLWRHSAEDSPKGALAVDARLNIALGKGADVHEGVSAFLEKRPPVFPGTVSTDMPQPDLWAERLLR